MGAGSQPADLGTIGSIQKRAPTGSIQKRAEEAGAAAGGGGKGGGGGAPAAAAEDGLEVSFSDDRTRCCARLRPRAG